MEMEMENGRVKTLKKSLSLAAFLREGVGGECR